MENNASGNKCNTKTIERRPPGRPPLDVETLMITFRLRRERSAAEDALIDRLAELTQRGQRSRFIRRVLTTGDVEPVLDREMARETARVGNALDALATYYDEDDDDDDF